MGPATCPDILSPRRSCVTRLPMRLLHSLLLASVLSGCSVYTEGRNLLERPREVLECVPECPSATEPVQLRHPETMAIATCGPYPHALYSSMAEVYRSERRQCVARYQQQGYVRLVNR